MAKECPSCRETNVCEKAKFCRLCGIQLVELPQCQYCEKEMWPREQFCEQCGRPRAEALTPLQPSPTSPAPPAPPVGKIRKFFSGLGMRSHKS